MVDGLPLVLYYYWGGNEALAKGAATFDKKHTLELITFINNILGEPAFMKCIQSVKSHSYRCNK